MNRFVGNGIFYAMVLLFLTIFSTQYCQLKCCVDCEIVSSEASAKLREKEVDMLAEPWDNVFRSF